jgi:hypothetical protein
MREIRRRRIRGSAPCPTPADTDDVVRQDPRPGSALPGRGTYVLASAADRHGMQDLVLTMRSAAGRWGSWIRPHELAGGAVGGALNVTTIAGHVTVGSTQPVNLHLFEAPDDGRVLHARLDEHSAWTPFADITQMAGQHAESFGWLAAVGYFAMPEGPGPYDTVDLYCANRYVGRVFRTTRNGQAAWSRFEDFGTGTATPRSTSS